jgi:Ser/Thr protein kinase RdoA (MazF antagonist)
VDDGLIRYVREAYGWRDGVAVSPGPRGALGQIWRVELGSDRFALKEIFYEPPSEALIEAELAFARRAVAAGVRVPASHPDREGRHLLTTPDGTWLRLYDWVDLRPVDPGAPATPGDLGILLARLHRCAPVMAVEVGGEPPYDWYNRVPETHEWAAVVTSGATWAGPLGERLTTLPELCAAVGPVEPGELIGCHRDLHPENVLADPTGALVVVDWDNLGPGTPGRELGRVVFDWFFDGTVVDLDAVREMHETYRQAGGPGRLARPADFTMMLACRLNFLLVQARVALDPTAEARHREWAEREIEETLLLTPTPGHLADVLAVTRGTPGTGRGGDPVR